MVIFVSCEDEILIIEPEVTKSSIYFPFDSREDGGFVSIYRNNTDETVYITLAYTQKSFDDSQNYDFCKDIQNFRRGIITSEWIMINAKHPVIAEVSVPNQNDHPNLISYSLPMGTYLGFISEADQCYKEQYDVFNITTNEAFALE